MSKAIISLLASMMLMCSCTHNVSTMKKASNDETMITKLASLFSEGTDINVEHNKEVIGTFSWKDLFEVSFDENLEIAPTFSFTNYYCNITVEETFHTLYSNRLKQIGDFDDINDRARRVETNIPIHDAIVGHEIVGKAFIHGTSISWNMNEYIHTIGALDNEPVQVYAFPEIHDMLLNKYHIDVDMTKTKLDYKYSVVFDEPLSEDEKALSLSGYKTIKRPYEVGHWNKEEFKMTGTIVIL